MATITLGELLPTFKAKSKSLNPDTIPDEIAKIVANPIIQQQPAVVAALQAVATAMEAMVIAKTAMATMQQIQPVLKKAPDIVQGVIIKANLPGVAMDIASQIGGGAVDKIIEQAVQTAIAGAMQIPITIPDIPTITVPSITEDSVTPKVPDVAV